MRALTCITFMNNLNFIHNFFSTSFNFSVLHCLQLLLHSFALSLSLIRSSSSSSRIYSSIELHSVYRQDLIKATLRRCRRCRWFCRISHSRCNRCYYCLPSLHSFYLSDERARERKKNQRS